ncbi:THAP domain-containing 11 [Paramuricea clavata]|uniref:THAP domain-containing 11 n=1 Tax=Paramuricea clavata TaxID=317549 RepID=A0A7D9KCL5_PARCT|nr:THAP domain-containing 11 [Paramuricea clavata]
MDEIICSTSTNTSSVPFCDEIIKTLPKKKARGGGTACYFPGCSNSTRRNPSLSFHRFPKDQTLRNPWIDRIGRSEFTPNDHHRVCSEHFPDGKKIYFNNIPTGTHADQTPNLLHQRTVLAELSNNTNQINIAIEVDKVNKVQSIPQKKISS